MDDRWLARMFWGCIGGIIATMSFVVFVQHAPNDAAATRNAENAARNFTRRVYGSDPARVVCLNATPWHDPACFVRVNETSAPIELRCDSNQPKHSYGCNATGQQSDTPVVAVPIPVSTPR